ncbi:MAG: twin-arginine translocase subunit TatC, partial [Kiloniellales bacterium]|nr:twin-arginine translocase subunit TatC [Kiloniellales bacterium]
MEPTESPRMSLVEHLEELRSRLLRVGIAVGLGMVAGLVFSKPLYRILARPMHEAIGATGFFIATDPIEAFMTYMKTGFVGGLFMAIPFIFYELWCFVAPGLFAYEKRRSIFFVTVTTLFFVGGSLFGYFVVFPTSFQFFSNLLSGTDIRLLPKMSEYFSFAVRLLLAFGIVFELPVLLLLLARVGVVTASMLSKARPYCIVGIFILAGVMTGPDVASQLLMAI